MLEKVVQMNVWETGNLHNFKHFTSLSCTEWNKRSKLDAFTIFRIHLVSEYKVSEMQPSLFKNFDDFYWKKNLYFFV